MILLTPSAVAGQELQVPSAEQGKLRADRVRYEARSKVFTAEGNVRLIVGNVEIQAQRLRLEQEPQLAYASGNVLVVQRDTTLRATEVKYEIRRKLAHAFGGVELAQGQSTVRAPRMDFDLAAQTMSASDGVRLMRDGTTIAGETMVANLRTKRGEVTGQVTFIRAAQPGEATKRTQRVIGEQQTRIAAPRLVFHWDVDEAEADGGVVVTQPDKVLRARRVRYSDITHRAELEGDVVVEQFAQSLVQGGIIEPPKDEETRRALTGKITLTCERLVLLLDERDMHAQGAVLVTLKGRSAMGDRAVYTNKDREILLTGNVRFRDEDGSTLRADRVMISLADETLEAMGNVEADFLMKRGK